MDGKMDGKNEKNFDIFGDIEKDSNLMENISQFPKIPKRQNCLKDTPSFAIAIEEAKKICEECDPPIKDEETVEFIAYVLIEFDDVKALMEISENQREALAALLHKECILMDLPIEKKLWKASLIGVAINNAIENKGYDEEDEEEKNY